MGKLAERYGDAARSGVYRVRDARVPLAAAAEAQARLLELSAHALANGGWMKLDRALREDGAHARVLLVADGDEVVSRPRLMAQLRRAAERARAAGRPFFAVLVDRAGTLEMPLLYKEKRSQKV